MATRFENRAHLSGEFLKRIADGDLAFKHRPLNAVGNIRLFDLLPGEPGDLIMGSLRERATSTRPGYAALSYTWGCSQKTPRIIWVDGVECFVRENLWQALDQTRSSETAKTLWIDALCIDQENVSERNSQVRKMDLIYHRAQLVHVWLGPSTKDSDVAISFMRFLGNHGQLFSKEHNSEIYDKAEQAVARLLKREYWYRAWTVQEFVLGRAILLHCGRESIPWDQFRHSCDVLQPRLPKESNVALQLVEHRKMQEVRSARFTEPLERLIERHSERKCKEPRDKIYSLLPLATGCQGGRGLQPDYGITSIELLRRVLQFCSLESTAPFTLKVMNALNLDDLAGFIRTERMDTKSGEECLKARGETNEQVLHKWQHTRIKLLGNLADITDPAYQGDDFFPWRIDHFPALDHVDSICDAPRSQQQENGLQQARPLPLQPKGTMLVLTVPSDELSQVPASKDEWKFIKARLGYPAYGVMRNLNGDTTVCFGKRDGEVIVGLRGWDSQKREADMRIDVETLAWICCRYWAANPDPSHQRKASDLMESLKREDVRNSGPQQTDNTATSMDLSAHSTTVVKFRKL